MKSYNIKLYDTSGAYIRTFSPNDVMSDVQFSAQTEGGQGELRLKLAYSYNSTNITPGNIVKVYQIDQTNPLGRQIYIGFVGNIRRVVEKSTEYIEARILGVASMLSWMLYKSGATYSFSKTTDPSIIVKEIVDAFSTQYPGIISYDAGSIVAYGTNINLAYAYESSLESLKKTAALTDYFWTIDGTGKLFFQPKSLGVTHYLTFGKDIDTLEIEENTEKVVNEYFLDWSTGTVSSVDTTSQVLYGKRQAHESRTDIGNSTTATTAADEYVSQNKDPKRRILLTINTRYDFEKIKPGDLITVRNIEYQIQGLQVLRLEYSPNSMKLELDSVRSLAKEIFTQ